MSSKEMTLSKIQMFEDMLKADFEPVVKILKARGDAVRDSVVIEVKKETGLYDLLVRKAKMELELDEIKDQIRRKTHKESVQVTADRWEYKSLLELEIDRRMEEVNAPLVEAEAFRNSLMREIKLSTGTPEIRALFNKLASEVLEWKKRAESLSPIKVKQLSDKDREVLKISET